MLQTLGLSLYALLNLTIIRYFKLSFTIRQCQRLFHELGFSKIRPQIHPSSGDLNEEERKAYKKNC